MSFLSVESVCLGLALMQRKPVLSLPPVLSPPPRGASPPVPVWALS